MEEGSELPPASTELCVCSDDATTAVQVRELVRASNQRQQEVRRGKGLNDNNSNSQDLQSRA